MSTTINSATVRIEQLMEQLEPGSERYNILNCARRFKSSWLDLGRLLQLVRQQQLYRQWGYDSFEQYCASEIHIRRATADKLTMAYHFVEQKRPALLDNDNLAPVPDFRSINLLQQAQAHSGLDEEQRHELHQAVFERELSHPGIAKRYKEMTMAVATPQARHLEACKSALSAARRLQSAMANLSGDYPDELSSLIETLSAEVDEATSNEE